MKWTHALLNAIGLCPMTLQRIHHNKTPKLRGVQRNDKNSTHKGKNMQFYFEYSRCLQSVLSVTLLLALIQFHHQAHADGVDWESLSPQQQEALAPMRDDWRELPPNRQERLRRGAERWNSLPPEQRNRLQDKMHRYEEMSPDDKDRIRERMREYRKLPPEERNELRERWRNVPPEQKERIRERMDNRSSKRRNRRDD